MKQLLEILDEERIEINDEGVWIRGWGGGDFIVSGPLYYKLERCYRDSAFRIPVPTDPKIGTAEDLPNKLNYRTFTKETILVPIKVFYELKEVDDE